MEKKAVIVDLTVPLHHMRTRDRNKLTDVFYDFYAVGEHSASGYLVTRSDTHAVVRLTGRRCHGADQSAQVFYCKNQWGQHVEQVVIEELDRRLPQLLPSLRSAAESDSDESSPPRNRPVLSDSSSTGVASSDTRPERQSSPDEDAVSVDLFINRSPCGTSRCCQALVDFKARHREVTLTVIFSDLYNMNLPSCRKCKHMKYPVNPKVSKKNQQGLQSLLAPESGIIARLFQEEDWRFLTRVLPLQRQADCKMEDDLRDLGCRSGTREADGRGGNADDDLSGGMQALSITSPRAATMAGATPAKSPAPTRTPSNTPSK